MKPWIGLRRRLVPDVETQEKILLEFNSFKNATHLFRHYMAKRQRKTKSPSNNKQPNNKQL